MAGATGNERERAILVGAVLPGRSHEAAADEMDEMALLADTAGADVVARVVQARKRVDPAFFIGRGKAEEIASQAKELGADLAIFDDDLSPAQVKNLEKSIGVKVVDRSGVILDIFARRARTRESRVQVALAQLEYTLPRLTRQWRHLSRQAGGGGTVMGGIGTRGPGETQLEVDRRKIRKQIVELKKALADIGRRRSLERRGREGLFRCALVGYTNAGKSTLMNILSGATVFVENRLFATLDPTTRAVRFDGGTKLLLTDTVGFIRKLPHDLIASFRATLEEAVESDLLLHVVDSSHPRCREQVLAANEVLDGLGIADKPTVIVLNKVDLAGSRRQVAEMADDYEEAVATSAVTGEGIDALKMMLLQRLRSDDRFHTRSPGVVGHIPPSFLHPTWEAPDSGRAGGDDNNDGALDLLPVECREKADV